jgi:hypothetical protein
VTNRLLVCWEMLTVNYCGIYWCSVKIFTAAPLRLQPATMSLEWLVCYDVLLAKFSELDLTHEHSLHQGWPT